MYVRARQALLKEVKEAASKKAAEHAIAVQGLSNFRSMWPGQTGPATLESSETETLPPAVAGPHFRGLKPGAAVAVAHRAAAIVVLWDN